MRDEQDIRLKDAHERALRFNEIIASLKQMQFDRERLEQNISKYKAALAGASLELYKLETKGVSFFDSVLGTPDKRLEMERNNTAVARLRCSRAEKELRELTQSMEDMNEESLRLSGSCEEYESLYEQKKHMLIAGGGAGAQQIIELAGGIDIAKTRLKEIRDAYKTCERALTYLQSSHKKLEKAKEWGAIDMLGGKFVARAIKHNQIKDAKGEADNAKAVLKEINTPATGIDIGAETDIRSTSTGRSLMDNIVADIFSQNTINSSLSSVTNLKSKLQSSMCRLTAMEHKEKKELDDKQAKLDSIILDFDRSAGS